MTKQFSSDLKLKAIQFYNKINNYSHVCKIFGKKWKTFFSVRICIKQILSDVVKEV